MRALTVNELKVTILEPRCRPTRWVSFPAAASSSSLLHYTKLPDANRAAEEESDREEKMMRQPNNPAGNLLSIRAQDGDFASLTSTSQMKNELLQL
jgi:hypothetical protein